MNDGYKTIELIVLYWFILFIIVRSWKYEINAKWMSSQGQPILSQKKPKWCQESSPRQDPSDHRDTLCLAIIGEKIS